MKALVTGGAGFIGSHLVDVLIKEGNEVWVIDNFVTGHKENLNKKAKMWRAGTGVEDFFKYPSDQPKKIDVVFHLAALARIQPSFETPWKTYNANSTGTIVGLEIAKKYGAIFVYAGSSSAYHDVHANPYSYTKWLGEQHCKLYSKLYEVPCSIARFFNVYGPRQIESGPWATVIGIFERQHRNNEPLTITGDGKQRRDFCLTGDALVLMADNTWKSIGDIKVGDLVVSFDEKAVDRKRKFRIKPVTAISSYYSDNVYKIVTDATCVHATGNHPWLDAKGKYRDANYLSSRIEQGQRRHIKAFGRCVPSNNFTNTYQQGYVVGSLLGDGYFTSRVDTKGYTVFAVGLAVTDEAFADRFKEFISEFGVSCTKRQRTFKYLGSKPAFVVQCCKKSAYDKVITLIAEADWKDKAFCSGFLAAIYDGEGEYHKRTLRIANKDLDVLEFIKTALGVLGFDYTEYEKSNGVHYIQLLGGHQAQVEFISTVQPAIQRKRINLEGKEVKGRLSFIQSIDKSVSQRVYNIEIADTHTFIANGLLCHNTHVSDIVNGLIAMSKEDWHGLIFNLGTGKNYSINEVADFFGGEKTYIPKRPGEAQVTMADIKSTKKILEWTPQIKLKDYIKEVISDL